MSAPERARRSLEMLALGDSFGEQFFGDSARVIPLIRKRVLPSAPWNYTDDSEMAFSIVEELFEFGLINQDSLAKRFAERMEPTRGYGAGTYELLTGVLAGRGWRSLSYAGFRGMGSFGNGAAMRVAPLGAFFASRKLESIAEQARLSAEVTHAHPEGIAGAVAVAVATALAWRCRDVPGPLSAIWLEQVRDATPAGYTRDAITEAMSVPHDASVVEAAAKLGNGSGVTAPDTVPLCLWVAAYADNLTDALWDTVGGLGDRDTTCAIVAGILGARFDDSRVPNWHQHREPFPWALPSLKTPA